MKRILHLTTSIQGNQSYSIKLGKAIVQKAIEKYPGSTVEEVDLNALGIPHLNPTILQSMFAPAGTQAESAGAAVLYSDYAVKQLLSSDIIVIGAPFYNFTIPSVLKAWIDHITRPGLTFRYEQNGPVGMVTGKKVYIAMASGGVYSEGPMADRDFVAPYLKSYLGFLGMTDLSVFRVEGVKVPGIQEHSLEQGIASIHID
ncbi:FMN-dependent NADH-azoreductase [Taibaiella chishuiensis]|uniref:FMN dependent NADH:quinone oxidoreductase n=1 Tax=Taibaiella chishuiensis TaxID=1434707 RepID=A0A2P8D221_9BACT|nr:NAD(P)H-dependent oxidoreductase [Taibaiella chishuiensis]PSK91249.1 FMN-dependent NADH-azoreductase [Taibaiella chishuiensis]